MATAATPALLFLLDTSTVGSIIRGADAKVLRRLQSQPVSSVAISSVTEGELHFELAGPPGATALAEAISAFLRHVQTLPWDSEAAVRYGAVRARLEGAGRPLGQLDIQIAAHALSVGATLVTQNKAFRHVPDLTTANWMST